MSDWKKELTRAIEAKETKEELAQTEINEFLSMVLQAFYELEEEARELGRFYIKNEIREESRVTISFTRKRDFTKKLGYTTAKLKDPNKSDFEFVVEAKSNPKVGWRIRVRKEQDDTSLRKETHESNVSWYEIFDTTKEDIKEYYSNNYIKPGTWGLKRNTPAIFHKHIFS